MNDDTALRCDDLQRSFPGREVLAGLSFAVRPGEVYALLGRNGAGKTTAIRVLLGFLRPDGGRSTILGHDSLHLPPRVRDRIGYVAEGHVLYRWMRVEEVLRFEHGTRLRFDLDHARTLVARLGLSSRSRVSELSRGGRAQLLLAVAVAARPDVLVLDDPASGLDAVVRRELLEVLVDAIGEQGCAVLLTSHVLPDVERLADRIGLLHGGRLVVDATIDDLKRRVARRRVASSRLPQVAGLLAARPVGRGFDLTLLDHDRAREAELLRQVESLSPPETPSLEELFLELLGDGEGALPETRR